MKRHIPGLYTAVAAVAAVAAAALLAAGCTGVSGLAGRSGLADLAAADTSGAIVVQPGFASGAIRAQALVTPYTKSDVSHLVVKVSVVGGPTEVPVDNGAGQIQKDVPASALTDDLRFSGLRRSRTYRVRGYAFKAAGTADADLISKDTSYVDIVVAHDDRPAIGQLAVYLLDKTFSGSATGSVTFKDGPLTNGGDASFEVPPPSFRNLVL